MLVLSAASTAYAQDTFVRVRKGDSLYRIASTFGSSVSALRKANGISGDVIHPGQTLRLPSGAGVKSKRNGSFKPRAPLQNVGRADVVSGYGTQRHEKYRRVVQRHTGLDLRAKPGSTVVVSEHGVVRFSGELSGYGWLVIVEHDGDWRTVYAPMDPQALRVKVNEAVYNDQVIGFMGEPVETDTDALHFEVRRGDDAVDPRPLIQWPRRQP